MKKQFLDADQFADHVFKVECEEIWWDMFSTASPYIRTRGVREGLLYGEIVSDTLFVQDRENFKKYFKEGFYIKNE